MKRLFYVIAVFLFSGCSCDAYTYLQHIQSPDKNWNYALYTDNVGIGDPGFYVLKLEKEIDPENLNIKWSSQSGIKRTDSDWFAKRTLLNSYEEAGYNTYEPKIEIFKNRYLTVFRGGYYYSLYDLKVDSAIIDVGSPWHGWQETYTRPTDMARNDAEEEKLYDKWVEKNLHNKIISYIK